MRVQSVNQSGMGTAFTALPSATTLANAGGGQPGAAGFSLITSAQLRANWTANGNSAGTTYNAILSIAPSPSTNGLGGNQTVNTTNLFADYSGLSPNTLYYVDVNAGSSAYTSLGSAPTLANSPTSAAPTNIQTNQITANWGANGNPAGTNYLVEASLTANFGSIISQGFSPNTSFTFTGLSAGTTYYFQVQADNQNGIPTAFTVLPSAVTPLNPPGTPTLSDTVMGISSITWNWSSVPFASGYRVLSQTKQNLSGDLPASQFSWPEINLSVNTAYTRHVEAFNNSGTADSPPVTAYTFAEPPTGSAIGQVFSSSVTLSWQGNGNPAPGTSYQVQYWAVGGSTQTLLFTTTNPTVTGLGGDTSYFFTVQAVNGAGVATSPDVVLSTHTLSFQVAILPVMPDVAQTLSFIGPQGPVVIQIPAQSFVEPATMTVTVPGTVPPPMSAAAKLMGTGVDLGFVVTPALEPLQPLTLTMAFNPTAVAGFPKDQLILARYDPIHNVWVPLRSQLDANQNTLTAQTDHLSIFQIMVTIPAMALNNVKIFPNPFRPALGQMRITFSNLTANSTVRLYTVAGEKVMDLTADATGMAFWDGTNQSGQKVASGVYFALVQGAGDKKVFNVAIQR